MNLNISFNYFDIMYAAKKGYSRLLEPVCRRRDLTRNELDILLFLYNNPEFDRAADIVSRRGIAKSHVSMGVASLEEKGLLIRHYDEKDRRMAHMKLTAAGSEIAEEARKLQMRYFAALYEGVTPEEFEMWRKITEKVCGNIEKIDEALTNV